MWNSDYYTAPPHRVGGTTASSSVSAHSSHPPPPPPAGVLSPDLARPISVRDLAQTRALAGPPPRASAATSAPSFGSGRDGSRSDYPVPLPRTSGGGFAGFGVPKAPVVYAATSGLLPSWSSTQHADSSGGASELSTHGEASDLTSLAERNIDHLSNDDLYNYASHLQDTAKRYSHHLAEAHAKRDMYRNLVAVQKRELQEKYVQIDRQRHEQETATAALRRLREDNTQLREQVATAEGKVRNIAAKLSLQNGADPSVAIRAYQAQLASKEAQVRDLMERVVHASAERQSAEEASQRRSSEGGANPRQSDTLGAAGTRDHDQQQQRLHQWPEEEHPCTIDERVRRELAEANAAAAASEMAKLQAELNALHQRNAALQEQLAAQDKTHAEALASMTAEHTELKETIAQLKQGHAEMQENEDALVAALTQRAPVSKTDFEAFQATYAEMQAALTKTEATVATLQAQQNASAVQDGYIEVLQQSLATSQAERQELTEKNRQLQALSENLQREVQLADTANRLRQQQLETAVAGGEQLAQEVQRTQEARHTEVHAEIVALRARCAAADAELQRLRAENEELSRQMQDARTQSETNHHETQEVSADNTRERSALEAELETLRNARDNLVVSRDSLLGELRELEERRQTAERDAPQQSTNAQHASETHTTVAAAAAASSVQHDRDTAEDTAMLQAAQQCIEALERDLETTNSAHARMEVDMQVQLRALETKMAEQADALRSAQEQQKRDAEAYHNRTIAAAAEQKHLEEVIQALKEELEFTQTQNRELRQSESASRGLYTSQLRQAEQLRERVVELERRASDVRGHELTPPSTQPASVGTCGSTTADAPDAKMNPSTMSVAIDRLAQQLAEAQDRVHTLETERHRQAEALQRVQRVAATLEDRSVSEEHSSKAAGSSATSTRPSAQKGTCRYANGVKEGIVADQVATLIAQQDAAAHQTAQLRDTLEAAEARTSAVATERDAAQQRAAAAEEEVRVARAALEKMAAELSDSAHRVDELSADIGELATVKAQLAAVQRRASVAEDELSAAKAVLDRFTKEVSGVTRCANNVDAVMAAVEAQWDAVQQREDASEAELRTAKAALERVVEEASASAQHASSLAAATSQLEADKTRLTSERDAMQQRAAAAEEEVRVARAALEKMAAELSDSAHRVDELSADIGELATVKAQLAAVQRRASVAEDELSAAKAVLDRFTKEVSGVTRCANNVDAVMAAVEAQWDAVQQREDASEAELRTAKAALERVVEEASASAQHASSLAAATSQLEADKTRLTSERDAMQQRAAAAEEEVRVARAALEKMAAELSDSAHRVDELSAAKACWESEKRQRDAELARLESTAAEWETRTADVERRSAEAAAASEKRIATLAAEAAALEKETVRLKARLSAARGAVSSLAEDCTDVNTQTGDLTRHVEREVEQRKSAEAMLSALKRELVTAQAAVVQLTEDLEMRADNDAAMRATLKAEEEAFALLKSERDAAQQRAAAAEEEVRVARAALEKMAAELSDSAHRVDELSAAKACWESEKRQRDAELARLESTAAEWETRTADVERRSAEAAAASEKRIATLAAEAAALEKETVRLKARLSAARGAVSSLAEDCTDVNTQTGDLTRHVEREVEQRKSAEAMLSALKRELVTAQAAVVQLTEDLEMRADNDAAMRATLKAEEEAFALLKSERDAAQQRAAAAEEEVRVARAALEKMAAELSDSAHRVDELSAAKACWESEKRQRDAELARLESTAAEWETRTADVERRSAEAAAASEKRIATLAAEAAALEKETVRLKARLSAARGAVSSLAEDCTDVNTQTGDLTRHVEREVEQRKSAEAMLSALKRELVTAQAAVVQLTEDLEMRADNDAAMRATLKAEEEAFALLKSQHDDDRAELSEVRRRGEELQRLLDTTLDRLAQEEELVKGLNDNAADLHAERAALTEEVVTVRLALETVVLERQDIQERLDAAKLGLEQTAELYNERILEDDRLQDELDAVTQAFSAQTMQVKQGMRHMLQMSAGFHDALEAVMALAAATVKAAADLAASCTAASTKTMTHGSTERKPAQATQDKFRAVTAINAALTPWSAALEWVATMQRRVHALEGSSADSTESPDRISAALSDGANDPSHMPLSVSLAAASTVADAAKARGALTDFVELQEALLTHLRRLGHALDERDYELRLLRSAVDEMANSNVAEKERADHLLEAIQDAKNHVSLAEKEFDDQLQLRSEAVAAELVVARRAEERATDARLRAESQLAAVGAELTDALAALHKTEEERRKMSREVERLSRFSARLADPGARVHSGGTVGSVTPPSSGLFAEGVSNHYTMTASAVEALEQAHLLQVSSLQQELLLSRRQIRELERQEVILRQANVTLEQQVSDLRADAEEAVDLREEVARLRAENADLEEKIEQLERILAASGGGVAHEVKQLRQQLKLREAELEEEKARMQGLLVSKTAPEFAAARRQAALRESLSGITTQLAATQAQYSSGRSPRGSLSAALSSNSAATSASPLDVLSKRIDHLQSAMKERDALIEKMKAAQLQSHVTVDGLEERLSEKAAALERANALVTHYAEALDGLRAARVSAAARTLPSRGNTHSSSAAQSPPPAARAPPTPLALQTSVDSNVKGGVGDSPQHMTAPVPSPAPRMPHLAAVEAEAEVEGSLTPPATSRRRTGATGESSSRDGRRSRGTRSTSSSDASSAHRSPPASSGTREGASHRKRTR
ncbi:hypothetical protein ABB37_02322 [Leptomonas pyrrhocoris]|uniref:Uncharacterized protein n=1 Tax=Leptomonas pyrrhocoris TaxID=157538 RepID=A0A0N0DYQ8_LEPPY|nr:hypothetical protein ABB37_02322 [Leptomonas pyrrhocoris]KPA84302.1 hypothetical protein ABB37_02322 [Leptomonas pyrrhocoris]|eukprot:XP_015662741.1 hypothetical protein ABB37_02322 [Leptomonas pyrrhocoris]